MNRGRNHASDNGRGNWLHHIGPDAALPQDGHEAGEKSRDGHQLWPQSLYGSKELHNTPFGTTQQFLNCFCKIE
jgi:hypothetical protein